MRSEEEIRKMPPPKKVDIVEELDGNPLNMIYYLRGWFKALEWVLEEGEESRKKLEKATGD